MNGTDYKRRDLLKAAGLGAAALAAAGTAGEAFAQEERRGRRSGSGRQVFELKRYFVDKGPNVQTLLDFLRDAAIPAMNRIGIEQVGVFQEFEVDKPAEPNVWVLMVHRSLYGFAGANSRLLEDAEYVEKGKAVLAVQNKKDAIYKEAESNLMIAFTGMPKLEAPDKGPRVFELRTYQSFNTVKAKKKIHMFNEGGEIQIFRETGPKPVFYGETLAGVKMPNLTYMTTSKDMDEQNAGWEGFRSSPAWNELKAKPEYKGAVSQSTKTFLKPASFSQI